MKNFDLNVVNNAIFEHYYIQVVRLILHLCLFGNSKKI